MFLVWEHPYRYRQVLVVILQHTYRVTGRVTSGLLFLFWFTLMVCQCLTLISIDSKVADEVTCNPTSIRCMGVLTFIPNETLPQGTGDLLNFVTFHVFYFFVVLSFVLSCFGEPKKKAHVSITIGSK